MEKTDKQKDESLIAKQAREKARGDALTKGFHGEGEVTLCGHKLRPFTFGSLTLCRRLKLSLFTDEGSAEELNEAETLRQMSAFFWIQSQPVTDVLGAVRAGKSDEAIDAFQFEVPVHVLPRLMDRINELSKLAGSAAVEVEAKPDSGDDDTPVNL